MPTDPVRLALVVAGLLLIVPSPPSSAHLALLIGIAILLAVSTQRNVRLAAILVLLAGAIVIRVAVAEGVGSDVLDVTKAAIDRMLAGQNPYGTGYDVSRPPGAPFPYGPLALLWYVPLRSAPELMELGAAIVVSILLALRGRILGLAVYGTASVLVTTAVDGSNDSSLGLILLLAFIAAVRWPAVGAAVLGLAVGFKLSALAFVPAYVAWGGLRIGLAVVAASLIAWAPVIAGWGIASFLRSAQAANDMHRATVWSLGKIVKELTGSRLEILDQLRFVFGGALAVASLGLRRSLDTVILTGAAVYLVTLFAGNWATFAYFAGIAPLICWRLDDWLGFSSRPIVDWPRSPRVEAPVED